MKRFRGLAVVTGVFFAAAAGNGDDEQKPPMLPGATGPLYEKVAELMGGVEVLGADVSDKREPLPNGKYINAEKPPKNRILPSGTGLAMLWVHFNRVPDTGGITIEVQNEAGKLDFEKVPVFSHDLRTGKATMSFLSSIKNGVLPDGPYQAKLKIGDEVFLLVNWHVGLPAGMPADTYVELRLDQSAKRHDDLEERLVQLTNQVGKGGAQDQGVSALGNRVAQLESSMQAMRDTSSIGAVLLTLALINAGLAQGKNRSGLNWFLLSLLVGPLATFILVAFCEKRPG